jgi:iron complex outermembrane receptor protein
MRKFKSLLAAAAAVLPMLVGAAHAQSIDYGSLETLFGEPVTTSATGSPQRSTEVPVDMTIISADDIKRSGAHDLPTLLGRVPGLDVLSWSAEGADVGVRGYDQAMSPRLLVLINGRQVYLDHYGYTAWSTIPVQMSEIRQIEVVKGPNSALFGFNAVSGVVNIITYNPKYDTVDTASVGIGSRDEHEGSLVQTFRLNSMVSARLSLGAVKQNEWDNTANLGVHAYRNDPSRISGNFDAVATLTDKTQLRFESSLSNSQDSDMISTYGYYATKYVTGANKLDLTSDTQIGMIEATAYRNTLSAKSFLVTAPADFDNSITDFSVNDLFKIGAKHTFRLSLEQRRNTLLTTPVAGGDVSYDVAAVSGMWNWAISDAFSVDAAVRSDNLKLKRTGAFPAGYPLANNAYWDRKISKLSYNAGAVWRVDDKDTLKAMAAQGVQLPTLVELGGLQLTIPEPGYNIAYMGDPFLQVAVVKNYELSYDHSFSNTKVGVRLFDQKTSNIKGQPNAVELFQAPTRTTYPAVSWQNVGDSKMSGVELTASGKLAGGYRWSGDYTTTDVKDTVFAGHNLAVNQADYAATTPKGRGNASFGWTGGKWSLDGFVHYTTKFESYALTTAALTPIKAYTTLAANVSYAFTPKMSVALSGQNLGNSHLIETTGLRVPQTVFLTVNSNW